MSDTTATEIGLNAVIVAVTAETPRILTVRREAMTPPDAGAILGRWADSHYALPFGPFEPEQHRTLDLGLRSWVEEQTGVTLGYVEQLYTFADRHRDPRELAGGPRIVSIGYLALVHEAEPHGDGAAEWRTWYEFLPWEDWRKGRPPVIDAIIRPQLLRWASDAQGSARAHRDERVTINFGLDDAGWDSERVLERYELLYEAGLVAETERDSAVSRAHGPDSAESRTRAAKEDAPLREALEATGRPLELDHRRILATALGRIRGKLRYRPVVFELLPDSFTLLQLQRVVEALSGVILHKQNFRRLVINNRLVEPTGAYDTQQRGRPAKLFRFRRDVLRERPAPGVGVPALRMTG